MYVCALVAAHCIVVVSQGFSWFIELRIVLIFYPPYFSMKTICYCCISVLRLWVEVVVKVGGLLDSLAQLVAHLADHSLPSADSRRAVVSFWQKNVYNTG